MVGSRITQALVTPQSEEVSTLFSNPYGHFDARSGEFVISDVLTPRPWINVLANAHYGLVLSQAGSGFSWLDNCQLFRINRWEQDLVTDRHGRYIYLRDLSEPDVLWSTTAMPTRTSVSNEEVRHGLGATTFTRRHGAIETQQTTFVPVQGTYDVSLVTINNHGGTSVELEIGTYLEWHLGGAGDAHREFHRLFTSVQSQGDTTLAWKRPGLEENVRHTTEEGPTGFVRVIGLDETAWFTDKQQFLGRLGQVERPQALLSESQPVTTGRWDDPVAGSKSHLHLNAYESRTFAVIVGAVQGQAEALKLTGAMTLESLQLSLEETLAHHAKACGGLQVECDDPVVDLMVNRWLPYQTVIGRMTARCAYYQQGGAYGYRDQLQDSLMLLEDDPDRTFTQIGIQAEAMYPDGSVRHWWHPHSPIFAKSRHSDTCLWLSFATLEYLDETGDLSKLDTVFNFASDTQDQEVGTLFDHCQRGIERALSLRSSRGLPLIGAGDWNDGLSHAGLDQKGESVWLAMFLFHILQRFSRVCANRGDQELATRWASEAASLQTAVETYGWDGEWYIAGTDDEGRAFGSNACTEGKIFLNPQTWAVITGIASPERAKIAMNSVRKHLLKPYGALLLAPAYHEVDPYIGYITRYAPGLRENGGVYSHAATWAVQALAMTGDAEGAYGLWRGMCPPVRAAENAELYAAEPYVMPGNADGPDSPFESRAGWTWYTGSAAWMRRVFVRWILGLRPEGDRLTAQPCLPESLGSVSLIRTFRGKTYNVSVSADSASLTAHAD